MRGHCAGLLEWQLSLVSRPPPAIIPSGVACLLWGSSPRPFLARGALSLASTPFACGRLFSRATGEFLALLNQCKELKSWFVNPPRLYSSTFELVAGVSMTLRGVRLSKSGCSISALSRSCNRSQCYPVFSSFSSNNH